MKPNPGHQPAETVGKRVMVMLACGRPGRCDEKSDVAAGWLADTTRWSLTGCPFDVASYRVL